ncbi:hypothetical protein FPQ18DRAFT_305993 [Pyronema domesticum]|nr:hypothetical protein FPQ18DRAFT_305993 [Pyronema domesticum]
MKEKIKEFFRSLNCFRPSGKKLGKKVAKRASTFNVISVTLLASQTAAPAEAARRSMFVGLQKEADSQAALCRPPDDDDDVVSLASSGSPVNAPDDVVAAAEPAPSSSPPLETVQEFLRATVRAVPEEPIFGPSDEHAVHAGQPTPPAATNDEKSGGT